MRTRRLLIGSAIVSALGLGAFFVAFWVTADLTVVADEFFATMASGDFDGAYGYLTEEFHGNTSVAELRAFAQESALANYEDATWWHRSISGDDGTLDGQIETETGEVVPVTMYLLREGGEWRIHQIDWGAEQGVNDEASGGSEP